MLDEALKLIGGGCGKVAKLDLLKTFFFFGFFVEVSYVSYVVLVPLFVKTIGGLGEGSNFLVVERTYCFWKKKWRVVDTVGLQMIFFFFFCGLWKGLWFLESIRGLFFWK